MQQSTEPFHHLSVLARQVVALAEQAGSFASLVDGTLGGGGHSQLLLERFPQVRLLGMDRDQQALQATQARLAPFGERVELAHACFDQMQHYASSQQLQHPVLCLLDIGLSSPQVDVASRGFSFLRPGPLDMRMDQSQGRPLAECLGELSQRQLQQLLWDYGEERYAGRIAKAILAAQPTTTQALAEIIAGQVPKPWKPGHHPATRSFQALRIWLNDELGQLERWLNGLPQWLTPGCRVMVISFHSLEDRLVKRQFRRWATACHCPPKLPVCQCGGQPQARLVGKQPLVADEQERMSNPRARSAKLRTMDWLAQPNVT